ncbi:MAG TPA: septal ring lytic transglycosylase RlpA family protein [Polyangiaceae bacterium]|nr:septal ring lytic transglycosylase RlpA family protein [Polyangiaceae bacterium]
MQRSTTSGPAPSRGSSGPGTALIGMWLLLVACGDSQPAKAPLDPARQPKTARASHISLGHAKPSSLGATESTARTPQRSEPTPAASTSSEQLAERYAASRVLSVQVGSGSYYSDKLAGRCTASGRPYEPHGFTAAHRSLPFGSVLRVTREDGGQVVYVRVTDRGPFARGRILDLSRAAAERLDMLRAGVVPIRVEVLEYGLRRRRR